MVKSLSGQVIDWACAVMVSCIAAVFIAGALCLIALMSCLIWTDVLTPILDRRRRHPDG